MRSLDFQETLHHFKIDGLLSARVRDAQGQAPYGTPDQFGYVSQYYSPSGHLSEASLYAPEATFLGMGFVTNGLNGIFALIGNNGLSECDGGFGPLFKRGIVIECGDRDGSRDHTAGYLSFTPRDASSGLHVVNQLALLTGDRLSGNNRKLIETAYNEKYATEGPDAALQLAQMLVFSAPEVRTYNKVTTNGQQKRLPTATSQSYNDEEYSATVVVFLDGGLDCLNLFVPLPTGCRKLYEEYAEIRGSNHLMPEELIEIDASTSNQPCDSFGVNKNLEKVASMYNYGELAFIAGIGHLRNPVNKTNYQEDTLAQLFSHPSMSQEAAKVNGKDGSKNSLHIVLLL